MAIGNLLLTIWLILSVAICLWQWRRLVNERRINQVISRSLEKLMETTRSEIEKNKKLIAKAKQLVAEHNEPPRATKDNATLMDDPVLLATVVTVLINKYGTTALSLRDFEAVEEDSYVSVYVDTESQDLILSLDRDMADMTDPMSLLRFGNSDDDPTYH